MTAYAQLTGIVPGRQACCQVRGAICGANSSSPARGLGLRRPRGAVVRADRQRPELVEGETAVGEQGGDLVDAVELGVLARVGAPLLVRVWNEMSLRRNSCRNRSRQLASRCSRLWARLSASLRIA